MSVTEAAIDIQQLRTQNKEDQRPFHERAERKTRTVHEASSRDYANGFDMTTRVPDEAEQSIAKERTGARDAGRSLFRKNDPALRAEALRLFQDVEATGAAHVAALEAFETFAVGYGALAYECHALDLAATPMPAAPVQGYEFRSWCSRVRAILEPAPAKSFVKKVREVLQLD